MGETTKMNFKPQITWNVLSWIFKVTMIMVALFSTLLFIVAKTVTQFTLVFIMTMRAAHRHQAAYTTNSLVVIYHTSKSLVTTNCISCYNPYYEEGDDDAGGNADEMVTEMCATVYQEAGKCETDVNIDNPDTDACDYITRIVPSFDKLYNNEKSKVSNSDGFAWFFGFTTVVCLAVIGYLLQTSKKQSVINLS